MSKLKKMYEKYRGAMAYIEVENKDLSIGIGSAFHVGHGVFVTAKHVVSNTRILSFGLAKDNEYSFNNLTIVGDPLYHPDKDVYVAIILTDKIDELPSIDLGGHLDDWINDEAFFLSKVLVMGFPPIPLSDTPILVTTTAEVNAVVDPYLGCKHPQFILSAMARGGFSGGVALIEFGFALGVITESLVSNYQPAELGYFSVLTVEPILVCLAHHNIMPKEFWDELGFDFFINNIDEEPRGPENMEPF